MSVKTFLLFGNSLLCAVGMLALCACGDAKTPPAEKAMEKTVKNEKAAEPAAVEPESVKVPASAAPDLHGYKVKIPQIKMRNDEEEKTPVVEVDSSNIVVTPASKKQDPATLNPPKKNPRPKWTRITAVPADSLAAQLTPLNPAFEYEWGPKWIRLNAGNIRVPQVRLSPDKSVFAFLETTGTVSGPFGSRIVLLNAHTWEVIRILDFPGRYLTGFDFMRRTANLVAVCAGQKVLDQKPGIAIIDLKNGTEREFRPMKNELSNVFVLDQWDRLYIVPGDSNKLLVYSLYDLKEKPGVLHVSHDAPITALAVPHDLRRLYAASGDKIEIYKTTDLNLLDVFKLESPMPVKSMAVLPANIYLLAPDGIARKSLRYASRKLNKDLTEKSNGILAIDEKQQIFCAGSEYKGILELFQLPSLESIAVIETASIAPKTTGMPREIFFLPEIRSIAVFDTFGNFYLLHKEKNDKHYTKDMVLTNKK